MGVEEDDVEPEALRLAPVRLGVLVPDAVLRARAAGVAGLHVPVAEPGVEAQADGPAVADARELPQHAGRPDVGEDAVLAHHRQRVVAEDVGRQQHDRRLRSHGETRGLGAEGFVARDGIDPDIVLANRFEHGSGRAGFHGVARLQPRGRRHAANGLDAVEERGRVVEIEGRAHAFRDGLEVDPFTPARWHAHPSVFFPGLGSRRPLRF